MIKLNRGPKPVELTVELQDSLTQKFKQTEEAVWDIEFLKQALLTLSNDKCCYCEADISEESKYMEVEHFHHKNEYKDEVLEWDNLLPSCKRCNGTKNDHDTVIEPIIDPSKIDPRDHLKFWCYRIKGSDELGKLTISVLNLNDPDRLVKKRYEIGNAIEIKLEQLNELADDYVKGIQTSTRRKNRIINGTKDLMKEGLPTVIYAATTSTMILNSEEYYSLKDKIKSKNLWDNELEQLELELTKIRLNLAI